MYGGSSQALLGLRLAETGLGTITTEDTIRVRVRVRVRVRAGHDHY